MITAARVGELIVKRHPGRMCRGTWVLAVLLAGCGDHVTAPPPTPESTWKLLATGEVFVDVWGCSSDAVFLLGRSSLLFYNGSNWIDLPDPPGDRGRAIWGTSPKDVFVIEESGDGPWSMRSNIYHYDGVAWEVVLDRPYPLLPLRDLWGSSDHDIFAVGDGGTILHYDGHGWSQIPSGTDCHLRSLWGTSSRDLFAAGGGGTILHYDGSTWSTLFADPSLNFFGIWASSSSDIYCIGMTNTWGDDGMVSRVYHYDGSACRPVAEATGDFAELRSIWASSSTDIYAVGEGDPDGTMLHYDGVTWTQAPLPVRFVMAIWGSSSRDVFVVGGEERNDEHSPGSYLTHFDGTEWRSEATNLVRYCDFSNVGGSSAKDVYFLGGGLDHFNGSSFDASVGIGGEYPMQDFWASPNAVYVVGDGERVYLFDGSLAGLGGWRLPTYVNGVWALSRINAFVVGEPGDPAHAYNSSNIYHYDGAWTAMTTGSPSSLSDIWGSSEADVFAVGQAGTVLHYDGSSWTVMPTGTNNNLSCVWGSSSTDVYAVGDSGTILHYDGVQWMAIPSMTQNRLTGVWSSSDRDVYVVGGIILHFDGKAWTRVSTVTDATKVWGSSDSDVYVLADARILHYGPR
jgi:hypothetical protein